MAGAVSLVVRGDRRAARRGPSHRRRLRGRERHRSRSGLAAAAARSASPHRRRAGRGRPLRPALQEERPVVPRRRLQPDAAQPPPRLQPALCVGGRGRCRQRRRRRHSRTLTQTPKWTGCQTAAVRVHLIDGTYELFRHHYGQPKEQQSSTSGATRGVCYSLITLLEEGATHVGMATDHIIESFRNDLWPGYKSSAGMPEQLLVQFPLLEEAVAAMGI